MMRYWDIDWDSILSEWTEQEISDLITLCERKLSESRLERYKRMYCTITEEI